MFGQKKNHGLYYLLPGMSRANRLKRRRILKWAILVGLICSALIGLLIWLLNKPPYMHQW